MSRSPVARTLARRTAISALTTVLAGLMIGGPVPQAGATAGSADTPPASAGTAGLQQALDRMVRDGAPGALLYTYDRGKVRVLHSGSANIAADKPMRPAGRFRVGSITKSYVSTVVLELVAQHRLHLSDPVSRYLPGLVAGKPRISIRQLLGHTSGIYEFNDDPRVLAPYLAGHLGHVWTPRQLARIAMSHPLVAPPGTAYHYSNANYVLAGLVVQRVTGHSLAHELRARVLRPAHLSATTFTTARRLPAPAVHGYFSFEQDQLTDITSLYPYPWASGAAAATASDVAGFYRHLLSGGFLPPRLLAAMKTTVDASAENGPGTRYGLGLESFATPCGRAWGHGGNFPGYLVYAYSTPSGSRQSVLMVNVDPQSLPRAAGRDYLRLLDDSYCG